MIDIDIQISISERSSGWATNYFSTVKWLCEVRDFNNYELSVFFPFICVIPKNEELNFISLRYLLVVTVVVAEGNSNFLLLPDLANALSRMCVNIVELSIESFAFEFGAEE